MTQPKVSHAVLAPSVFGFLNINKPAGMTAHDVVARVRKILRIKQVGHAGTLDPLARGVLPVAVGKATRLIRFLDGTKTYLAEIKLGMRTTTDDLEGEVIVSAEDRTDRVWPHEEQVKAALVPFVGAIEQLPPMYSAVHIGGRRLYELARKGMLPDNVPLRPVHIHRIDLLSYEPPVVHARIKCGAGTYIRSIARDLGETLELGGCLQSLLREQAGNFGLDQSVTLDQLQEAVQNSSVTSLITAPESVLPLATITLNAEEVFRVTRGQTLERPAAEVQESPQHVIALYEDRMVAVCRWESETESPSAKIKPEVVLTDGQAGK